jgi:hypothetical protein
MDLGSPDAVSTWAFRSDRSRDVHLGLHVPWIEESHRLTL